MKTAMQELLDIIYKAISNAEELKSNGLNHKGDIDIMLNVLNVYRIIIERDMIEKEKEQIIKAYEDGADHGMDVVEDGLDYVHSTEYFNQNYTK